MRGLTLTNKEQARLFIMNGVLERQWTIAEAAQLLGVSERHIWRILAAYRKEGAAAIAHGNRGRLPMNATLTAVQTQVIALARERYQGVNHTHFTELLAEREGVHLSRSTVRRLLVKVGIPSTRQRRPPSHRYRRVRMPQEGMLIQVDGSRHRWLGDHGPWLTLLLAVDDATGTVPYALFREQEDTVGYFHLMKGIIERRGIPLALYSDRGFVFCNSRAANKAGEASYVDKVKPTQFGRAMRELGVTQVFARSPEAKGRIERANGTFQDRLVAEMRLAGVSTIEEANSVLEVFLTRFNERFGVRATDPEPCYRLLDPGIDLDALLCFKERRRVAKDNTVQYHGQTLQIFPGPERRTYARAHVEVQERLDGRLFVYYQGKLLTPGQAPPLAATLRTLATASPENVPKHDTVYEEPKAKKQRSGLGWDGDWYRDELKKSVHGDLVRAGMERARQQGKHIGRPRVTDRPEFAQRYASTLTLIGLGELTLSQAARKLDIGYTTLKRLMDDKFPRSQNEVGLLLPVASSSSRNTLAEVL
jgi:transposase